MYMNYFQVSKAVREFNKDGLNAIFNEIKNSPRNQALAMFRDYYHGLQWDLHAAGSSARDRGGNTTRSGKKEWDSKDKRGAEMTFTKGELKVWNVCDATVDIYSSYCRGSINDENEIQVDGDDTLQRELNDSINVDKMIVRTVHRASIDSGAVWKYVSDESGQGSLEFVDAMEYFPVYRGDNSVGTIRAYKIEDGDPLRDGRTEKEGVDPWYMEVWLPEENGDMWLYKYYIGQNGVEEIEKGVAPYTFDPHFFVVNKDSEYVNFDTKNTEISDIAKIIDVQDDINAFMTDMFVLARKVAIPMYKITSEVYSKVLSGELPAEALKRSLEDLTFAAGRVMAAPIEQIGGEGIPNTTIDIINSMFDQLYRATGIPSAVYVSSEAGGNIAARTVENMMESLKRRIDEKRANIEAGIKWYAWAWVKAHGTDPNDALLDAVTVQWADMFEMSKEERVNFILEGQKAKILPTEYSLEKVLEAVGDRERLDAVLGMSIQNGLTTQVAMETARIRREASQNEGRIREQAGQETRKLLEEKAAAQSENKLLRKELDNFATQV